MPNPTTKLASFLFKERRPSQTYLELSSSRKCLAAGKVQERKRKRREKREKIKARLKNKTLFTKAVNETYKTNLQKLVKLTIKLYILFYYKTRGAYIGNLKV